MKFNNWTLDDLIEYLKQCKSAPLIDCHYVTRCFGEITMYNGECKDGKDDDNERDNWIF